MTELLAVDPGYATGWAVFEYDDDTPARLSWYGVTSGGLRGLKEDGEFRGMCARVDHVVVEKFVTEPGGEFAANIEGVPAEGLIAERFDWDKITWQTRSDKGPAGMMDAILQKHHLWQRGKKLGWADGRDCNDAIIHGLIYLRNREHLPTLGKYFRSN